MGTYMVERYLPGVSEEALRAAIARVQAVAAQMQAEGVAVGYLGSTFAPEDQCCFCLFAGPSQAAVRGGKPAGGVSARAHRPGGAHLT